VHKLRQESSVLVLLLLRYQSAKVIEALQFLVEIGIGLARGSDQLPEEDGFELFENWLHPFTVFDLFEHSK